MFAVVDQDEDIGPREPGERIVVRPMTLFLHGNEGVSEGQNAVRELFVAATLQAFLEIPCSSARYI
ncbi:hypothetical protein QA648_22270 (plasmid) [Rhizobium sp. CB3171]|uniref:hypothetical protein n=1 Tax=unclassified Rhizobium TaxID=2613769 RepID=UPI0024B03F11|nr:MULTISPECIES: hypothetical protein [unclassified Rhizobium]MDK4741362.1 hypothetical protein [Rhizobium sp. CNPSo 3464]WFU05885.1 hypothetical protein QA648_22270 [Rhizobium sp. CB3171]